MLILDVHVLGINNISPIIILGHLMPIFHRYTCVIHEIKRLLHREWDVTLEHTLREGNSCADFLAKEGAN